MYMDGIAETFPQDCLVILKSNICKYSLLLKKHVNLGMSQNSCKHFLAQHDALRTFFINQSFNFQASASDIPATKQEALQERAILFWNATVKQIEKRYCFPYNFF